MYVVADLTVKYFRRRMADAGEKMATREDRTDVDVQKLKEFVAEHLGDKDEGFVALYNEAKTGFARSGGTWILEPLGETRSSMLTGSNHDAFNVRLEVEGVSRFDGPRVPIPQVAAGEAVTFSVTRSWGADNAIPRVAWANDEAGAAQEMWNGISPEAPPSGPRAALPNVGLAADQPLGTSMLTYPIRSQELVGAG